MATYTKLDGNGEEVNPRLLGNLLASGNTGEIDIARLNKALGTGSRLEHLFGKATQH